MKPSLYRIVFAYFDPRAGSTGREVSAFNAADAMILAQAEQIKHGMPYDRVESAWWKPTLDAQWERLS